MSEVCFKILYLANKQNNACENIDETRLAELKNCEIPVKNESEIENSAKKRNRLLLKTQ